jgi:hypothetical protein
MNAKLLLVAAACLAAPLTAPAQQPRGFQQSAIVSPPDGFMSINGALYKVTNGFAVIVAGKPVVRGIDGNPVPIPAGGMYTTDGRLIPIPPGISGLPVGLQFRGRQNNNNQHGGNRNWNPNGNGNFHRGR